MWKKLLNVPNTLTLSRVILSIGLFILLCVPFFAEPAQLALIPKTHITALDLVCTVVFILLASTDGLDGHIARSTDQVTDLGKVLDPLADKLLVDGTMIMLSARSPMLLPPIFTVLFVGRDLMVDGMRIMCASKGHVVAANMWGKVKTVMEMILIPIVMLRGFPLNFVDMAVTPAAYEYSSWIANGPWSYDGELYAMIFCLILGVITLVLSLLSGAIYLYRGRYALTGVPEPQKKDENRKEDSHGDR